MRVVKWLHISDLHLKRDGSLSQNAVLSAMRDDIERRCDEGLSVDFVLVTGDLAYSGKKTEYQLVEDFFRDLAATIDVSYDRFFCVPGNHDVQRDRQMATFAGARQQLQSENDVYAFLANAEERGTLLVRQGNFRRFQEDFLHGQERRWTSDGLGYVTTLEVDDFRIALLGLNSAWLAEGGRGDDRQLLLGEPQVANAIELARQALPHVVIGLLHHPFDLLMRFDQKPTQRLLEESCHFLHCGHLHEPHASQVANHSGRCLSVAAGASFESRTARNAYTAIAFDPLLARAEVTFVQYEPTEGRFLYESKRSYEHEIDATGRCESTDLSTAIDVYCPDAKSFSAYLASLLLGDMSEVPIQINGTIAFGTIGLLERQCDDDLAAITTTFLTLSRAIKLLHGRKPLNEILSAHGVSLRSYVDRLRTMMKDENGLKEHMARRDRDARRLSGTSKSEPFGHTLALLDDLLAAGEWEELRGLAERCSTLDDPLAAAKATRLLALCLARSSEVVDRSRATDLYRQLAVSEQAEWVDWAGLATLLADDGHHDQAQVAVMAGIRDFPEHPDVFIQIGMKIVAATGDIDFREKLRQLRAGTIES